MNLFDLYARIVLDKSDYDKGIDDAGGKMSGFADKVKSGVATVAKISAAGLAATAAGAAALTKAAIDGYAEYEQLSGGVETLFGQSADAVMKYADNAYKTAGMSANQYMQTVTGFSASLLQSMGGDTEAAAKKADQAITDMSDNANKMGTSIDMIQNAYGGFAKQNFTMLDNLKLGYGGTKEEMQRLLDKANELNAQQGIITDYQIDSYADIVDAIHVVQTEMGITGTTATEASSTIQGSVSSMKSAWSNLVTGIAANNADIDVLMDNFLESAKTVASNILPVVQRVIANIFTTLEDNGPEMIQAAVSLFLKIATGALRALPSIVASIPRIIEAIVAAFASSMPEITEVGKNIVRGLWEGIKSLAEWISEKVSGFFRGIVDKAKGVLGIHSPSRVFSGIGENMALGLENGWDSEYSQIKSKISNGLNFETGKINTFSSGIARVSSALHGAEAAGQEPITIIVQSVLDGNVIGETVTTYQRNRERAYGLA